MRLKTLIIWWFCPLTLPKRRCSRQSLKNQKDIFFLQNFTSCPILRLCRHDPVFGDVFWDMLLVFFSRSPRQSDGKPWLFYWADTKDAIASLTFECKLSISFFQPIFYSTVTSPPKGLSFSNTEAIARSAFRRF